MLHSGAGLKYLSLGNGPDAVVCHPSLGVGRFLFHRLQPILARHFTVITYDPRGIGDNADFTPSLDDWVNDVGDLMDASGCATVHLVGVSLGCWVMARAAAKWPERSGRMVLMGATVGFANGAQAVAERRADLQGRSMEEFARSYVDSTLMDTVEPEVKELLVAEMQLVDPAKYLAAMQAIYLQSNEEAFAQVPCQTLILAGTRDVRTPPKEADRVAEIIPHAQVRAIPKAGHLALLDQPTRVAEWVERFLLRGQTDD